MSEYRTPQAFRAAFEARQRKRADADGVPFDRVAQVDLYFRLLDRLLENVDGIVVKGGVALELRLGRARTTRDVDIRAVGNPARVLERLRQAGQRDHGDYLAFQVDERAGAETIEGDGVVYEGRRFRVTARFAGKPYRQPFGLDVAFGDPMVGTPDRVAAPDALSFAGIQPPLIPVYPLGTHLAEKVHAYTLPRDGENGRMKDLIDIALVASEPALQPRSMAIAPRRFVTHWRRRSRFAVPIPFLLHVHLHPRRGPLAIHEIESSTVCHGRASRTPMPRWRVSSIRCSRRQRPAYGCRQAARGGSARQRGHSRFVLPVQTRREHRASAYNARGRQASLL